MSSGGVSVGGRTDQRAARGRALISELRRFASAGVAGVKITMLRSGRPSTAKLEYSSAINPPRTRELLGWQPKRPGLIADLDGPRYFTAREP